MIATREWTKQVSMHRSTIQQWKHCVTHVHLDEADIVQRARQQSCINAVCWTNFVQLHKHIQTVTHPEIINWKRCNRQSEYPMRRHWVVSVEHTSGCQQQKTQNPIGTNLWVHGHIFITTAERRNTRYIREGGTRILGSPFSSKKNVRIISAQMGTDVLNFERIYWNRARTKMTTKFESQRDFFFLRWLFFLAKLNRSAEK
jgi:hypothetical protein